MCAVSSMRDLQSGRHTSVWYVGRDGDWYIPGVPGGITTAEAFISVDNLDIFPGTSGAPLVSKFSLVGMILSVGVDQAKALPVVAIREAFDEWGLSSQWQLDPCPES